MEYGVYFKIYGGNMHKYIMYVCNKCNYESKSYKEMNEHEAAHLGLTVKEMETYKSLKSIVQHLRLCCIE